jgi:hypothetical protein
VQFYSKNGVFRVQTSAQQHFGQGVVASRRRARRRPRRPRRTPPKATSRPRPRLSHAPVPQVPWESAQAARRRIRAVPARCAPRTASPSAAPAVPRSHLRGHALVSMSNPAYLNRASSPLLAPPPLPAAPLPPPHLMERQISNMGENC